MDGMNSPSAVRVKIDGQGRMVLPRGLRERGARAAHADGLLMTAAEGAGTVRQGSDGLPVLSIGRRVTNDDVRRALEQDRADR